MSSQHTNHQFKQLLYKLSFSSKCQVAVLFIIILIGFLFLVPHKSQPVEPSSHNTTTKQSTPHHTPPVVDTTTLHRPATIVHQPKFTFTSPDYSSFYNNKIFTCGSRDVNDVNAERRQLVGVKCGISNQIYEAIACMAVGLRLGFTQYLLPKFCTNGDWGLCNCLHFVNASAIFDMDWMQKQARQELGIDILEDLPSFKPFEHVQVYPFRNYTFQVGLEEQAQLVHGIIQHEKPVIATGDVVNMGFSFGKWHVSSERDELLYLAMYNLFRPTQQVQSVIAGLKQKWFSLQSAERLVVVHVQIPRDGNVYPGCQTSQFKSFYELLVDQLKIPKRSAVLLVGAGFEIKKIEDMNLSAVEDYGIYVHIQPEILSISRQNQLLNSQIAMTLAFESDAFISTSCETQFASHILRVRKERGLKSCSSADITLSERRQIYPSELVSKQSAQVPFTFPLPLKGKIFTVERCTAKFWE